MSSIERNLRRAASALGWIALGLPAVAQGTLWKVQHGTTSSDVARSVAADGSVGAFVAGETLGVLGSTTQGHSDAWLARHAGDGSTSWIVQFGSTTMDRVSAVAADGAGGAFVSGNTIGSLGGPNQGSQDVWLARADANGDLLWQAQFGTSTPDTVVAMARDGADGVFLAGLSGLDYAGPHAGGWDAFVQRVDGSGQQLWARSVSGALDDFALAALSDGAGGVIVAGATEGTPAKPAQGGGDGWIARFDADGALLWRRLSGWPGTDNVVALASDGAGGFFAAGAADGSALTGALDVWLGRYDANGAELWIQPLELDFVTSVRGLAEDGAGGVYLYVAVRSDELAPLIVALDYTLARFGGLGDLAWIRRIGSGIDGDPAGYGPLCWDGGPGLYVCGSTYDDFAAPNAGAQDAWLARLHGSQP